MSEPAFYNLQHDHYDILRVSLEVAQLPNTDLLEPGRTFFVLSDDSGPIGYIGLQGDGADRLMRSLVVLPSRQGQGYGTSLLRHLEIWASKGVERLHLLTTTAAPFFKALGYRIADRATAPRSVASSAEFTTLCPASATYMTKILVA